RELELRLVSTPRITLKGANDLAGSLARPSSGTATQAAMDPAAAREAAVLFQKGSDAYYDDRSAFALDRFGALASLYDRTPGVPVADRVRLLLWRTAVFLALKDEAQAESEALAALTLNPELKVDLNEFRPSVKDMVDRIRARGLHTATVMVTGLPAGATVTVDDRSVSPRFVIPIGKHRITASAPGRRDVTRTFDASGDLSVPMTLPIALDPSLESALAGMVWRGQPSPSDVAALANLAARTNADWLVVGGTRVDPAVESRVAVFSLAQGGPAYASPQIPNGPGANAALCAWVDARLQSEVAGPAVAPTPTQVAVVAPTPRPSPRSTPRPSVESRSSEQAVAFDVYGGLLWKDRSRTLSAGRSFTTAFGGVGPRVGVDATREELFGLFEAALVNYDISTLDVTLPDNTTHETVKGGSSTNARLELGWRHAFNQGDWEGDPQVRVGAGILYESLAAEDVKDVGGAKLGLLSSYTREALEISADGRYPISAPSWSPAVLVGLRVSPFGAVSESPSGTTGKSPSMGPGVDWRVGGVATPMPRLQIEVGYEGGMRSTKFKGPVPFLAGVTPQPSGATVSETFHGFGATARWKF
ncbi:MAG TPA: hypothetical protein VMV18_08905, partial [bacterium]|nr:hypothetical protein [bacterium]